MGPVGDFFGTKPLCQGVFNNSSQSLQRNLAFPRLNFELKTP